MTSSQSRSAMVAQEQIAVSISWPLAREAVRVGMPDLELPPGRQRHSDIDLIVEVAGRSCTAELRDPQTGRSHPIEIGAVTVDPLTTDGFMHVSVHAGEEELLAATLRTDARPDRLLYARTTLLSRLGILGGRYGRPTLGA